MNRPTSSEPDGPALQWQVLPGAHAGRPALRGEWVATGSLAHLALWRGDQAPRLASSPVRAPGWPVLTSDSACWGPGRWPLPDGRYTADAGLLAIAESGARVPTCWAWRDDGAQLLVCLAGRDGPGASAPSAPSAPLALLTDATGQRCIELRHDPAAAAGAACLGHRLAVVGSAGASVHNIHGERIAELDNPSPALRLAWCADERRLLLVESGRLSLFELAETAAGPPAIACIGRWTGRWIDAAPAPDGALLAAVDGEGRLALIETADPAAPPRWLSTDDPVQAVAADAQGIAAVFMRGPPLRRVAWPQPARQR